MLTLGLWWRKSAVFEGLDWESLLSGDSSSCCWLPQTHNVLGCLCFHAAHFEYQLFLFTCSASLHVAPVYPHAGLLIVFIVVFTCHTTVKMIVWPVVSEAEGWDKGDTSSVTSSSHEKKRLLIDDNQRLTAHVKVSFLTILSEKNKSFSAF